MGRDDELGIIGQALSRLQSGQSGVVEVAGEPGIGKTRLLDEFAITARRYGCVVACGGAGEAESDAAYGVVADALNPLLATLGAGTLRLAGQSELPLLAAVFPSLPGPPMGPGPLLGLEQHRLFAAVRGVLGQLSRRRPLVVIFDDLHWADAGSIKLLGYLLRRPPPGPMLLTLAYRPRQVSAALARAIDEIPSVMRIALGPLCDHALDCLLYQDGRALSPPARGRLYALSGGNPFYFQALVRSGEVHSPASGVNLPEQIRRAVLRELDRLSADDRELVELAAVVGDIVRPEILAAVAQVSEDRILETLDELVARDLVRETSLPEQLRFRHPVLWQSIYQSLLPRRRVAMHRQIAGVLETRGAPLVERAYHLEWAAVPEDAAAASSLAQAAAATLAEDPATAVRWYAGALRLLPKQKDTSATRFDLLLTYADALFTAGRVSDAAGVLDQARSLLTTDNSAVDAQLVVLMGRGCNLLGKHDRAADLMMPMLASLPDRNCRESVGLRLELARVAFWRGDYSTMFRFTAQAVTGTRLLGADLLAVDAAVLQAFADYQLGHTTSALGHVGYASQIVDAMSDGVLSRDPAVLSYLGHVENMLGCEDAALHHLGRGLIIARHTGKAYVPLLHYSRALTLLHQGRLSEAGVEAESARDGALTLANDLLHCLALSACTWVARDRGDPAAAVRYGEQALAIARGLSTRITAVVGLYLAEALYDLNAPERAISVLLTPAGGPDLAPIEPSLRPRGYEVLVCAELARGQIAAAERYTELALACPIAEAPRGRLHARRAQASVLYAQRRHHEAIAAATMSVTDAQAAKAPMEIARSRLLLGRVHVAVGHREQALCALTQAEADLDMLGSERQHDVATGELRALGMRSPQRSRPVSSRPEAAQQLSTREWQVARLVATGRTNRQIATQLHITENTVETHLRRIFNKLKVSSRTSVAMVASATA